MGPLFGFIALHMKWVLRNGRAGRHSRYYDLGDMHPAKNGLNII